MSRSSTNRSVCNKVVFSMPPLHDLGCSRYGGSSNRCITSAMDVQSSVCLSSSSSYSISSEEARTVSILEDVVSSSSLAPKTLVPISIESCLQPTPLASLQERPGNRSFNQRSSSKYSQPKFNRLADYRKSVSKVNFSEETFPLISSSWRTGTLSRYNSCWNKWSNWCQERGLDTVTFPIDQLLEFLTYLFNLGLAYNTVNLHRSAISRTASDLHGKPVGQHPLVCRLLKSIFNRCPPQPKLFPSWSVRDIMSLLKTWGDNSTLDFQRLSGKTAFLLAIISFKRSSDLIRLNIREEFMQFNTDKVILQPISLGKTHRPTHLGSPITVLSFPEDSYVCPLLCLKQYILCSNNFRGKCTSLFIATKQP